MSFRKVPLKNCLLYRQIQSENAFKAILSDYIFGSFCSDETFFHCVKLRIYDEIVNKKTAANNNTEMIQRD